MVGSTRLARPRSATVCVTSQFPLEALYFDNPTSLGGQNKRPLVGIPTNYSRPPQTWTPGTTVQALKCL